MNFVAGARTEPITGSCIAVSLSVMMKERLLSGTGFSYEHRRIEGD